jgi:hypothetical protein
VGNFHFLISHGICAEFRSGNFSLLADFGRFRIYTLLIFNYLVSTRAFGGELCSPDGGFAAVDSPAANRQTRGTFSTLTT